MTDNDLLARLDAEGEGCTNPGKCIDHWHRLAIDAAAALRACDRDLATARTCEQRRQAGWVPEPSDQAWRRQLPDPPEEWRRLGDVPRGWQFRLNADDPQWRLLNTEATFMWDIDAQVLCRPQTSGGWEPMSDAERAWLASVVSPPTSPEAPAT